MRDRWVSLIIGICCLAVYNANGRAISAGDAFPARYLPFAIWAHRTLTLDPIDALTTQGRAARSATGSRRACRMPTSAVCRPAIMRSMPSSGGDDRREVAVVNRPPVVTKEPV